MEKSNLPEAEFRITIIRMLNELMRRIEEYNENLKRETISKDIKDMMKGTM